MCGCTQLFGNRAPQKVHAGKFKNRIAVGKAQAWTECEEIDKRLAVVANFYGVKLILVFGGMVHSNFGCSLAAACGEYHF